MDGGRWWWYISNHQDRFHFDSCIFPIFRSVSLIFFKKLFRPDPGRTSHLSLLKVLLVSSLGLYIGAAVSQKMASFLEENDLFVPEDDDDDWTLNSEYFWILRNICTIFYIFLGNVLYCINLCILIFLWISHSHVKIFIWVKSYHYLLGQTNK